MENAVSRVAFRYIYCKKKHRKEEYTKWLQK